MTNALIRFCMEQKLVVLLITIAVIGWGIIVSPFRYELEGFPRDPIPVDAIPDLGDNQQIVFTEWPGRSPQDVENQVTYPLTTALQGLPGVKNVRSTSMFGFSSVYVIFEENVEFYWSRSRILEKLNSLPSGTLPPGVQPALGPDATGMGQIFWYTLEGRTLDGNPAGGWDLEELRSIQDWYVRFALQGAEGVSEVASVGGFVREYQIDVDPNALREYDVTLAEVVTALEGSNIDVGASTLEHNGVEYVVRARGFIQSLDDIRLLPVTARRSVPITIGHVASVELGPAQRRGALDKGGAEAVGGVVAARFGANPLEVIDNVKARIAEIAPGLPRKTLADGTISQVTIVPFYDRTGLIEETLGTLEAAIRDQMLITLIVVLLMAIHLRSSLLIGAMLPLAVLLAFVLMKLAGIQANLVALAGIGIAIGTVVDMGIVLTENMLQHLKTAEPGESRFVVLQRAAAEVGEAVVTAISTTIISFLPVFFMVGAEGKLFKPLAYTKTFALFASIVIALTVLPALAHVLFRWRGFKFGPVTSRIWSAGHAVLVAILSLCLVILLALTWEPLGAQRSSLENLLFTALTVGSLIGLFWVFQWIYGPALSLMLRYKVLFLSVPLIITLMGAASWLGFSRITQWLPKEAKESRVAQTLNNLFPGMGREFMPTLDEGSFLYMPVAMPHASIGEAMNYTRLTDMAIQSIPEVELVVGKLGRAESPLDPAPVSMLETIIQYKPEYMQDERGRRVNFAFDEVAGEYQRDSHGNLIPDPNGRPFRNWRPEIQTPDDIWDEIARVTQMPGLTAAPQLAPIAARLVMLQSGMRAPMGVKVRGPNLETIEQVGIQIESILKNGNVPGVRHSAVVAERLVGVPYLEIEPDREALARHGITIDQFMKTVEVAIGGVEQTRTVEGRERYPVRIRYAREQRDSLEALLAIIFEAPPLVEGGPTVRLPLSELAAIEYVRGPMSIRSEDTFLTGYVMFDRQPGYAEVDVVENARRALSEQLDHNLPAGVSYRFAGAYENQVRAAATLRLILPLTLLLIFLIIYFSFRSTLVTFMIFSDVLVSWSGGFLLLWLWGQPWFLDVVLFETNIRELFNMGPVNLTIAVWVGFLALFGIATDDGVLVATFIRQRLGEMAPSSVEELRSAIVDAGKRRIRPCLMTSATTILSMLPIFTAPGKGSEIMIPLSIPLFGGMLVSMLSNFMVPVLYCMMEETKLLFHKSRLD
ncbi:MAG: efflux RND transporter permease subunit [Candidatus Sumerlaeia bacterium]|nr:efflux RND transporter permease subunit [Candidatus Sumerlaeia bacterium]